MEPLHFRLSRLLICFAWLAAWALTYGAPAADDASTARWSRFRGPGGAGIGEGCDPPIDAESPDPLWRVDLPGTGHSSPVVWDACVYVSSARQDDATRVVQCRAASDGRLLWQQAFDSPPFDLGNATAYDASTPAVDADRLYMAWAGPEQLIVQALDRHRGELLWRRDLGPYISEHGFGTSPIVWRDTVILMNDQKGDASILALDQRTGQTRWEARRECVKSAYSTPFVWQPGSKTPPRLITAGWGPGVVAYDPDTGEKLWGLSVMEFRCVGSPIAASGLILAQSGSGGGGKQFFAVRPADVSRDQKADVAYELSGSLPYVPTPIVHGDLAFLFNDAGIVQCIEVASGRRLWRERIDGRFFGSPVRVGERLFIMSREGELVVLAADRRFAELARIDLGEGSHSTPAVAGGMMYLRTFSQLIALGRPASPAQ